ncbi:methyltransferase domain-containing protein [Chloroflexota bacterium]
MLERVRFYIDILTQDLGKQAQYDWRTFCLLRENVEPFVGQLKGKVILDIGCGRRYPHTLILHSLSITITGIDTAYIAYRGTFIERYWKELTQNGLVSFGRAFLLDLLRQKASYYDTIRNLCGFRLDHQGITIKRMNADNLAFPDNVFDLVISNNCFEHIVDLRNTVSELHRVLKVGGFTHIRINLYASRSGDHRISSQKSKVPPWDHLRQNRHPEPMYLNRVRESEYVELFSEKLEVIKVIREMDEQGKLLLTPEIHAELSGYSEEELLTRHITIIARKTE